MSECMLQPTSNGECMCTCVMFYTLLMANTLIIISCKSFVKLIIVVINTYAVVKFYTENTIAYPNPPSLFLRCITNLAP